jgi:hypothetical protein
MAHALTFRNLAKNFQRQADALGRLAKIQDTASKALPQGGTATATELNAAIAAADLATRSFFIAEGIQASADAYTAKADEAFANGDLSEAP